MIIKILGTGCPKCRTLEEKVRAVVESNNISAEFEKVTDINDMMKYSIMKTPGLIINEKVKCTGVIPRDDQILNWLRGSN